MSDSDQQYFSVLLEIRDQNRAILDVVGQIQDKVETPATREDLERLETKVDTIRAVVTGTSRDLRAHERGLSRLEGANPALRRRRFLTVADPYTGAVSRGVSLTGD